MPETDLRKFVTLLYGREKIGKTSLLAQFEDVFFLFTEQGGKSLSVYASTVGSWREFKRYVQLLEKSPRFKNVVVDTVDLAGRFCEDHVCRQLGIQHPSDAGYGKGFGRVRAEFASVIARLAATGRGIFFVSHEKQVEIKRKGGNNTHRVVPSMSNQTLDIVAPLADIWAYYYYDDDGNRRLQLVGDEVVAAGHRLEPAHFKGIRDIAMGSSPEEAYKRFLGAFNNQPLGTGGEPSRGGKKRKVVVRR